MQNGIAVVDINSPLRLINQDIQLQGSGYDAYETSEGNYYSTSNGVYYAEANKKSAFVQGTEGPGYGFQVIANKLYVGHHTGLFLLENGRAEKVATTNGLWLIKQLRESPGYAVAGTYSGLYLFKISDGGDLTPVQYIEGFTESSRFFEEDKNGRIWVGQFYRGLYKLTFSEDKIKADVKRIPSSPGISIDDQIIISSIDDELYIGSNSGVYQLDPNSEEITVAEMFTQEIGQQPVYLLAQDNNKNIHVITEEKAGFYKQISPSNYSFFPGSLFQVRYSLNNDLLHISSNTQEGVLYSANQGFIKYDPDIESPYGKAKQLSINELYSVTQDSLLYAKNPFTTMVNEIPEIKIKAQDKVLQLTIESFQFDDINSQQFRYKLEGFDDDFSEWTNSPIKEFTNLKEGQYKFQAQSKNFQGQIWDSETLSFTVKPPIQRSKAAKVIILLLIMSAFYGLYRFQRSRINKKAQEEIKEKEEKFKAISQESDEKLIKLEEEKNAITNCGI